MSWTLIIIALVIGLLLLTLEIVVIPGLITGILGVCLIVFSIWETFVSYGYKAGSITLLVAIAVCAILLVVFMKAKTWKKLSLNDQSDSKVNQIDEQKVKVGARGVTIARLAPTGEALIDGEKFEVHSINKFVDPDRPIEVVAVDGYRIDVKEVTDDRF